MIEQTTRKVTVYFDGNKTPKGTSCSYVLIDEETGRQKEETVKLPDETTVPEAEYNGLIVALESFKNEKITDTQIDAYGDSQLVIKQIKGEWECKKPELRVLRSRARNLLHNFAGWKINWVPRENNRAK
ncbi:MAG: ribonuclease HI family protein [Elusimicrobiota bacterium]